MFEFDKNDLANLVKVEMPFGKYQGRVLIDLPEAYLIWFADQGFPEGNLGHLMRLALELKIHGLEEIVDPLRVRPTLH